MVRFIFLLAFFLYSYGLSAQFTKAEIGIAGLTCPSCSRSVEMAVRELDFVSEVKMDLANAIAYVSFKSGSGVSIRRLIRKVDESGFSVSFIKAYHTFSNTVISNGSCFCSNNEEYRFTAVPDRALNGSVTLLFVNKGFIAPKEYNRKWRQLIGQLPIRSGCCEKDKARSVYYITL